MLQVKDEEIFPENPFDIFLSFNNPIFYSILFLIFIITITFIIVYKYIIPRQRQHEMEKLNLEMKYNKMMAMFAENDPDPVFRFNHEGEIIFANEAGESLIENLVGNNVQKIFNNITKSDILDCVEKGKEIVVESKFGENYYKVFIKGISELGIAQVYFSNITTLKNYEKELKASKDKLSVANEKLQNILEIERSRISKELHDGLGQTLSYIKLRLEPLKDNELPIDERNSFYNTLSELLTTAINELKRISHGLKPRILELHGLIPALRLLVEQASGKSGMEGIFESYDVQQNLNPKLSTTIYRISQELINNIVKHSKAKNFSLQISKDGDIIRLIVDDDGVGFDKDKLYKAPAKKLQGMGLINLAERVENLDGTLTIDSSPGNGTVTVVEFPN
ncbi:MAG: sensor histidine kinase [Ignavibacteria bacterium]|jgi:signal transduction histidine kinase